MSAPAFLLLPMLLVLVLGTVMGLLVVGVLMLACWYGLVGSCRLLATACRALGASWASAVSACQGVVADGHLQSGLGASLVSIGALGVTDPVLVLVTGMAWLIAAA